jgi:hypothetical protein
VAVLKAPIWHMSSLLTAWQFQITARSNRPWQICIFCNYFLCFDSLVIKLLLDYLLYHKIVLKFISKIEIRFYSIRFHIDLFYIVNTSHRKLRLGKSLILNIFLEWNSGFFMQPVNKGKLIFMNGLSQFRLPIRLRFFSSRTQYSTTVFWQMF